MNPPQTLIQLSLLLLRCHYDKYSPYLQANYDHHHPRHHYHPHSLMHSPNYNALPFPNHFSVLRNPA